MMNSELWSWNGVGFCAMAIGLTSDCIRRGRTAAVTAGPSGQIK